MGLEVACLVRPGADLSWLEGKPVELVQGQLLGDPGELARHVAGKDLVFHVAGAVRARSYREFLEVNLGGTRNVLDALASASPRPRRLVHVSTVGVTGPPARGARLDEDSAPGLLTDYGRSKLEAEKLVLSRAGEQEVVVVRPSAIYGPRDRELLPVFKAARLLGVLPAMGGMDQVLDLVHVEDVARGTALAGLATLSSGEVFLLGSGRERSVGEMAQVLGSLLGRRVRAVPVPRPALWGAALVSEGMARLSGRAPMLSRQKIPELVGHWRLDITRARSALGYEPRWSLEDGMAQTLSWYRREGWFR